MKIASTSLLKPVNENLHTYVIRDKKYMTDAITVTIRRFGPSGSSKNTNIALEHMRAVIPKISNEIFFDVKYMTLVYMRNKLSLKIRILTTSSTVLVF